MFKRNCDVLVNHKCNKGEFFISANRLRAKRHSKSVKLKFSTRPYKQYKAPTQSEKH